jgi:bifunctional non-homologous end joining protein LigD
VRQFPCQPTIGLEWLIEIKHDGFRIIARKAGKRVKLYSRPGNDLHLPLSSDCRRGRKAALTVVRYRWGGCRMPDDGMASFDRIRYRRHDDAFDLIELNGDDLRQVLIFLS